MIGALIAIGLFGSPVYRIGALNVKLSISPSLSGETRLSIPPLGKVTAATHRSPLAFQASVDEANVEDLHGMLTGRSGNKALIGRIEDDVRGAVLKFAVRLLLLSFLGGAAAVWAFKAGRRPKLILLGGLSSAGLVGGALGLTAMTYNVRAFEKPNLTNTLRSAPWIVRMAQNGVLKLDQADTQIRKAAADISKLDKGISKMAATGDLSGRMKILVISDLHNNPLGMAYSRDLADLFDVDMVLDAGDLTDLGSQFESDLVKRSGGFDRPHVFVAGNHDSVRTVKSLAGLRDTFVPDGRMVTVKGLRILGQNDPAMSSGGGKPALATPGQISRAARKLKSGFRQLSEAPDILIVHEPGVAREFVGKVPIIISGHDHVLDVSKTRGSAWVRPGSAGASGVRYFTERGGKAMTAIILYVTQPPKVEAVAVDKVSITSPSGEFSVIRQMLR
jgi:predicted phosphodiesterase